MSDAEDEVFVTLVPRAEADHDAVRNEIAAEGLPVDEQTQFAGKAAFETVVAFARTSITQIAKIARKLLDADKIEEIKIEYRGRKVTLRGIPADQAKTVDELTDHIFAQLKV